MPGGEGPPVLPVLWQSTRGARGREEAEKKRQSPHARGYQGHEREEGIPGARKSGGDTRGTKERRGYQGHERAEGIPGARKSGGDTRGTKERRGYQGHERSDGIPGAREVIRDTRGTKERRGYQGHERLWARGWVCIPRDGCLSVGYAGSDGGQGSWRPLAESTRGRGWVRSPGVGA